MSEWQPVWTAPRDGTYVLLRVKFQIPFVARWLTLGENGQWFAVHDHLIGVHGDGAIINDFDQNDVIGWRHVPV